MKCPWFGGLLLATVLAVAPSADAAPPAPPNILWLTCEDTGPHLGCYGDAYAQTPHLDRFAARSLRYLHAWANAPVCAPARTTLISGVYPPSTGSEHMRSLVRMPPGMRMYPQFLRERGYYCINNSKEDYNLEKPPGVWDDSSAKAHWRNRHPDQPFFAVFNFTITHESQIRNRPHTLRHDPAQVRLPAYHPDTPEVRQDWAQYYDRITEMDAQAGQRLQELEAAGLTDQTIVFFYGDHGSGMPRSKRSACNSGLHVPLLIHLPKSYAHLAPPDYTPGGTSARLVAFVDFAPTLLNLVGMTPPDWMQGRAFLGPHLPPPARYVYGFRGRMDERYDFVRSLRTSQYVYVRNYLPHLLPGQHVDYMFQTPTTQVWKRLFDEGKLEPPRTFFWQRKPVEELYDLTTDPDEVRNLAGSTTHQTVLTELREALRAHLLHTRDLGFLPEAERAVRAGTTSLYELGHDRARYPLERILALAERASASDSSAATLRALQEALADADSAMRYWGVLGHHLRGEAAVRPARQALQARLADDSPSVRIAAAQALARFGEAPDRTAALATLAPLTYADRHGIYVAVAALNALEDAGELPAALRPTLASLPRKDPKAPARLDAYVDRLVESILGPAK